MLLEEFAETYKYKIGWLRPLAKEGVLPFVYKKAVKRLVYRNPTTPYYVDRKMWFIDDHKVDALIDFITRLKVKYGKKEDNHNVWTRSAIECYQAHLICANCPNYEVCKSIESHEKKKPMKEKVRILYQLYGKPPERILEND